MPEDLTERIKYYLDNDIEKLLRILYGTDISESQVDNVFAFTKKEDIPSALSSLIISRQLSKAKTREIYKNNTVILSETKNLINENL